MCLVKTISKLILLSLLIGLTSAVMAQTSPLTKKITVKVMNQPVEKALSTIGSAGKVHFSYNADIIPLDSLVSLSYQQTEVRSVLDNMFSNRFTYKTTGQYIIIQKKKAASANNQNAKINIKGSIVESGTNNKLANTSIYNINGKEEILTDSNGNFNITINPKTENISLAINNQNYQDTVIFVSSDSSETIDITLKPKSKPAIGDAAQELWDNLVASIEQNKFVAKLLDKAMVMHAKNIDYYTTRPIQVSLLPFAGTNYKLSGSIANNVSLNIFAGYSYGVDGMEMGGFFNVERAHVRGLQMAGFGNFTGGETRGLQMAGFFNNNLGKVTGLQMAGFYNMTIDSLDGVQMAGFANFARKKSKGVQLGGYMNVAYKGIDGVQASDFLNYAKSMKGVQLSGFANAVKDNLNGVQMAGFVNVVLDTVKGMQMSGFANFAGKEIKGAQIASMVNVAKTVNGLQLGFVNIADSVSGASIGFVNIIRKGIHQLSLQSSETGSKDLRLKLGNNHFYTYIGISSLQIHDPDLLGFEYGFGTLFLPKKRVNMNIDLGCASYKTGKAWNSNQVQILKVSADINIRLSKRFSLFAGPSGSVMIYEKGRTDIPSLSGSHLYGNTTKEAIEDVVVESWLGGNVGLKFSF